MAVPRHFKSNGEFITFCQLQRNEVPLSVLLTPEGEDYTEFFIGLECYETSFHENLQQEFQARVQMLQKPVKALW
ncbi:DUF3330 domain-containing protein [Permianibacter aggregans]|uniref:Uncharacterized protein DUF3330 n=1 Tax=Permianibacter aggregans TaxID=1510150 RepID=A0A4R6UV45_9GAMM|nr:DUF3330 domain-containing protein [Permianibacter aggregans]TDQ51248.1 uncharacterized protein DUF3330 [Permianibacter aggregans]